MSHLHEETRDKGFTDVDVVVTRIEVSGRPLQAETVHDARQLLPHVIC